MYIFLRVTWHFCLKIRNILINRFNNLNTGCLKSFAKKLHRPLTHWIRYIDGCGSQFKSGYVVADMLRATENYQVKSVWFNYFEFHEGKICSDSIGSIANCSFTRGMLKSQQVVCNIDDILAVIQNESKQSTKKLWFFILEKVRWFQKRLVHSREYCKIDGIMALHSLKFDGH